MKKKKIIYHVILALGILGVFLFSGCASKEKIENTLRDAERAASQSKYEEARELYKQVLSMDKENRDAQYGLEDLEKAAASHDQGIAHSIHEAIAYTAFDQSIKGKTIPTSGDYTLDEFLNKCGKNYKSVILKEWLSVESTQELSDKLESIDKEGNPIKGKEFRVGMYTFTDSFIDFSVYVPGSYDVGRDDSIWGGVPPRN